MDYRRTVSEVIDRERDELRALSNEIWQNPELAFKEYKAVSALTGFLKKRGFTVTSPYCELDTSFKAEITGTGSEGAHVCIICEYDALPDIGHACGHNLIAEAGVAAGLGIQAAIEQGMAGRLTVMGTPAEEKCDGKILLVDRGAFDGIDIAMMVHPGPKDIIEPVYDAVIEICVTYTGKASHAAAFPWEGLNALDAAVMAYTSLSLLRQQLSPRCQLHGVITEGGIKPEIIPERTKLEYFLRAPTTGELMKLKERVLPCFMAASKATGCEVNIDESSICDNLVINSVLLDRYRINIGTLGIREFHKPLVKMGSTDMGNVSHVVPAIHPEYRIGSGQNYHTHEFTSVTNALESHDITLLASKALAYTCIDVMTDANLLKKVKEQFDRDNNFD